MAALRSVISLQNTEGGMDIQEPRALTCHATRFVDFAGETGYIRNMGLGLQIGAVAQLGERVNGIHEVRGSIPLSSTQLTVTNLRFTIHNCRL